MHKQELLENSEKIRVSYAKLPLQGVWTWLTGKELQSRDMMWTSSTIECLIWACIWMIGGAAVSVALCLSDTNPLWLIPSIILTAGGARYIVATIIHHAVHHTVFTTPLRNRIVSEILSAITLVQPYDTYRKFHVFEHHGSEFSTEGDQDLAAIYKLGLTPGKTLPQLKLTLWLQCINPLFHLNFLIGRLKSNFVGVRFYRLMMSYAWLATLAMLAYLIGFKAFFLSIVLPLVIIYQVCSLLHLVTEHVWVIRGEGETVKESHRQNSLGRFCGEQTPDNDSKIIESVMWLIWSVKHVCWYLPMRILIVQGSLTAHDWHHRHGGKRDWPSCAQAREVEIEKEAQKGEYSYTDIWGLFNAIDYTLKGISESSVSVDVKGLRSRLN